MTSSNLTKAAFCRVAAQAPTFIEQTNQSVTWPTTDEDTRSRRDLSYFLAFQLTPVFLGRAGYK